MRSVDRRQGGLRRADEIERSRPIGGTPAGIFAGRVLRDGSATCIPATCGVPVWGSANGRLFQSTVATPLGQCGLMDLVGERDPAATPAGGAQELLPAQGVGVNAPAPLQVAVFPEVTEVRRVLGHAEDLVHQKGILP